MDRVDRMSDENSSQKVDSGQALLVALVALALIASLVMLFTDSTGALRLALLAALWAAVIGFFLVTRYRRQAQRAEDELRHREEYHSPPCALNWRNSVVGSSATNLPPCAPRPAGSRNWRTRPPS